MATTAVRGTAVPARTRQAGLVCTAAGLLGAASGIYLAVAPADVPAERYSYPLDVAGFTAIQIWFVVQHLGLIAGLLGLMATGAAGTGRTGRWGMALALAGMVLLTAMELLSLAAAESSAPSTRIDLLGAGYGVASTLAGVGLVMAGVAVLRAGIWQGWARWIPLALGVYVFVPMFPALAGPFVAARLAITGWMLLFALLGVALLTTPRNP